MKKTVEIPLSGHPDKICDRIAEAVVDEYLRRDERSMVDIQVLGGHGMVMIGGIADSRADFDPSVIAKRVYKDLGYEDDLEAFVHIERPTEDDSRLIVKGGSRDSLTIRGYATKETRERLPKVYVYALALARRLEALRRMVDGPSWVRADGMVQLTMEGDVPASVTVQIEHVKGVDRAQIQATILDEVIVPILGSMEGVQVFVNPAGEFTVGGFQRKGGASGKWVSADTYGGLLPGNDISFIGKDPSHPARAGRYMARFVAKQLVEAGIAGNVFITATYQLAREEPLILSAITGKGEDLTEQVKSQFDWKLSSIVEQMELTVPMYEPSSVYGTFGIDGAPWE